MLNHIFSAFWMELRCHDALMLQALSTDVISHDLKLTIQLEGAADVTGPLGRLGILMVSIDLRPFFRPRAYIS